MIKKEIRRRVYERDGRVCRLCGKQTVKGNITLDHVIPVAVGGADCARNLITACRKCNEQKASMRLESFVEPDVADQIRESIKDSDCPCMRCMWDIATAKRALQCP